VYVVLWVLGVLGCYPAPPRGRDAGGGGGGGGGGARAPRGLEDAG